MKRAFTLIELLVVIAIIAILAAILFPVFAQAKVAAKKTVDISNQKQLALATIMYLNDNDDRLFFFSTFHSVSAVSRSRTGVVIPTIAATYPVLWWNGLSPYIKSSAIFTSPMDSTPTLSPDAAGNFTIHRSYIACRYAEGLSMSQIDDTVDTAIITEKWPTFSDLWIEPFNGDFTIDPNSGFMNLAANQYAKQLVSAYLDGHAKAIPATQIDASPDLTGCRLVHEAPLLPDMCDSSAPGCTNNSPDNICNTFLPYSNP